MSSLKKTAAALLLGIAACVTGPAFAQEHEVQLKKGHFSFEGIFGTYDRAAVQRGYQIYNEVCSQCHSLSLLSYRNLGEIGFSAAEVKALAAAHTITQGDQERPAAPSDHFVLPNPAVTAAFNAHPPDLSVITKAREGGADYVYSLLQGYQDAPAGVTVPASLFYNAYFPGNQISMPAPLSADRVQYADGTSATLEQEAHDIATFLAWASEPELEQRHRLGVQAMLFLIILTGMLYGVKRKIWADVH
jgi:ubiquinol-cytochrome c reductase cytochrome c1 subunit